mgnify:CR=1 FL=1
MGDLYTDRAKYNDNYIKYLYKLALLKKIKNRQMISDKERQNIENYIISKYNIQV